MKRLSLYLTLTILLASCGTAGNLPSTCDNIAPGESILCDMAKERGIRIEDVGNAFIVINAIAIGEGVYTREEALFVCKTLRAILDDPITYIQFHEALTSRINRYPGLLEVATSYLALFNMDIDIYPRDRTLLVSWLDDRIKRLEG